MPRQRISLADLARIANSGKDERRTEPGELVMAGFDTSGISQQAHPTVADLSECLFFSPGDGRIWLQDQRMVLLHSESLGSLRRELIDSIGLDKARGLLTRAGYVSGARDAQLVRQQWPEADPQAAAMAGTRLHALEGVVQVELVHAAYDAVTGAYDGEFLWHNSSEDDEHIAAYGVGGAPACWMQVGYATGYVSTLFGRLIVFREVNCRSSGDPHCRVIGKSAELWDDVQQDLRYLNAQAFVGASAAADGAVRVVDLQAYAAANPGTEQSMVGASSSFNAACHMLHRVAPTTATVLFTGESGVGKEMFASTLHRISPRKDKPFVAINCAAIPETLMESELFGVERGAYTGAGASRPGRFERAHGGTLLLDEVGDLPLPAQAKLLRVLQGGEVERVGAETTRKVNVRLIAATNVDLEKAVREGRFRQDLWYRLNVYPICLPPLRERLADIAVLANAMLTRFCSLHDKRVAGFAERAMQALEQHPWPGNVRELENLVERGVILACQGGMIEVGHLFPNLPKTAQTSFDAHGHLAELPSAQDDDLSARILDSGNSLDMIEARVLNHAVARAGGNLAQAARLLGLSRAQLAYRQKRSLERDQDAPDTTPKEK
ncbi:MAG: sigma 54-interacting transcriptional regulator [Hydrogenophaga sp.]|nr:sigma 54-interacting transcriptional regulator [Hydrogenophaga sp.]